MDNGARNPGSSVAPVSVSRSFTSVTNSLCIASQLLSFVTH